MITQELLCSRVLSKHENRQEASDTDIRRGDGGCPPHRLSKGTIYFLKLVITINQENVSKKKENISRL